MEIFRSIEEFNVEGPTAVTIGTFDGVHIGHCEILEQLKTAAKRIGGKSVVLTFFPHPRMVLFPDSRTR